MHVCTMRWKSANVQLHTCSWVCMIRGKVRTFAALHAHLHIFTWGVHDVLGGCAHMRHCRATLCAHLPAHTRGVHGAMGGCTHVWHCVCACTLARCVCLVQWEGARTCNTARSPVHMHVVCVCNSTMMHWVVHTRAALRAPVHTHGVCMMHWKGVHMCGTACTSAHMHVVWVWCIEQVHARAAMHSHLPICMWCVYAVHARGECVHKLGSKAHAQASMHGCMCTCIESVYAACCSASSRAPATLGATF